MQALVDFGVEHREAGRPLFILMGGWTKQVELDKASKMRAPVRTDLSVSAVASGTHHLHSCTSGIDIRS